MWQQVQSHSRYCQPRVCSLWGWITAESPIQYLTKLGWWANNNSLSVPYCFTSRADSWWRIFFFFWLGKKIKLRADLISLESWHIVYLAFNPYCLMAERFVNAKASGRPPFSVVSTEKGYICWQFPVCHGNEGWLGIIHWFYFIQIFLFPLKLDFLPIGNCFFLSTP